MSHIYLFDYGGFDFLGLIDRCYVEADIKAPEMIRRRRKLLEAMERCAQLPVQIVVRDGDHYTGAEYAVRWAGEESMALKRWTDDKHRPLWNVLAERWSDLVYAAIGREWTPDEDDFATRHAGRITKLVPRLTDVADRIEAAAYTFLDTESVSQDMVNPRALDALRTIRSTT